MLLGTATLPFTSTQSGAASDTIMNTFHWLLILGFPVDVAAAKAMPELFSDTAAPAVITDGVRIFGRDEPLAA